MSHLRVLPDDQMFLPPPGTHMGKMTDGREKKPSNTCLQLPVYPKNCFYIIKTQKWLNFHKQICLDLPSNTAQSIAFSENWSGTTFYVRQKLK